VRSGYDPATHFEPFFSTALLFKGAATTSRKPGLLSPTPDTSTPKPTDSPVSLSPSWT
jgi:hypothetical protein